MPNPTITPAAWADGAIYTISASDFAAIDVNVSDIDEETAEIILTLPAGAAAAVVRDPASWAGTGSSILAGGAWTGAAVALGNWQLSVTPGAAATNPATVSLSSAASGAGGRLRILLSGLAGQAASVEPGAGTISIDRVLAGPSITNPFVFSGLPVNELSAVTLTATVAATAIANPAPVRPVGALPALLSEWRTRPANTIAVIGFPQPGPNASFTAPAVYEASDPLLFDITACYNLDGGGFASAGNPRNSGELSLTVQPVAFGICFVLDRSGSMSATDAGGGKSRWQQAVTATHACLDVLRLFRPGAQHKAGIVTFESSNGWGQDEGVNQITLRNPANGNPGTMDTLSGFGDSPALQLGSPMTSTPIGDGLKAGFEAVANGLNTGTSNRNGCVVLLTDGYENSGHLTIADSVSSGTAANGTFDSWRGTTYNQLIGDRLFVVAVGQQVDQDRLDDLVPQTSIYNMTQSLKDILSLFVQVLTPIVNAEQLLPSAAISESPAQPNSVYFPMAPGDQKIAFIVPWGSAADTLELAWRAQGAAGGFAVVNPTAQGVKLIQRDTYGAIVADVQDVTGGTGATEWRLRHISSGSAVPMASNDYVGLADLMLRTDVRFAKSEHYIGDPIDLWCSLRHGGMSVEGANVGLDIARPGESLGTFLTVNSGRFKALQRELPRDVAKNPDKLNGKGLMHSLLLKSLGLDELPMVTPPSLTLTEVAPGDYSASFTDTAKEGTYIFRYRIEGTLPDGARYSRLMVRSTWVGVRPDPALLNAGWASLGASASSLTFKPGYKQEWLGPYRGDAIKIHVSHGSADGPLVDNLDGSYTQRFKHERALDPIVSVEIYGTPMNPTGPGLDSAVPGTHCSVLWKRALLCTLAGLRRLLFGK